MTNREKIEMAVVQLLEGLEEEVFGEDDREEAKREESEPAFYYVPKQPKEKKISPEGKIQWLQEHGFMQTDEEPEKKDDLIHHPNHYNWRGTECKNCIWEFEGDEGYKRYCEGNIMKYLYRYEKKGTPLQDLMKGREYWDFLIEQKKRELAAQEAEEAYQNFSHADSLHAGKLDK